MPTGHSNHRDTAVRTSKRRSSVPSYAAFQLLVYVTQAPIIVHCISNHVNSSGWVINPTHRPLPNNTLHSQQTNSHAPVKIRTRNPSKRAIAHPRLRPRGYWDRATMWIIVVMFPELLHFTNIPTKCLLCHCDCLLTIRPLDKCMWSNVPKDAGRLHINNWLSCTKQAVGTQQPFST
jgi:hypothetical protein